VEFAIERAINAVTAATINHAVAQLWNPSTDAPIEVMEAKVSINTATAVVPGLRRSSARGTAGASTTTGAENVTQSPRSAPPSGAILDVAAFSVQPTLIGSNWLDGWQLAAAVGSGFVWTWRGAPVIVPPGEGLVIVTQTAIAFPLCNVGFGGDD